MAERFYLHVDHEICVAYYRNALSPQRASKVRAYLETHPDTAHQAQVDANHDRAIAQSLGDVLQEPIPTRLRLERRSAATRWTRRLALVATIVFSAVVGWWFGGVPATTDANTAFTARVVSAAQRPARQTEMQPVVDEAAGVPAPNLSLQGYQLVRQQRLASADPVLIEFIYRDARGHRLRIYAEPGPRHNAEPVVTSRDGMALAQWRDGGTRYALVGEMPESSLQTLAKAARNGPANTGNALAGAGAWPATQAGGDYDRAGTQRSPAVMGGVVPVGTNNDSAAYPNRM